MTIPSRPAPAPPQQQQQQNLQQHNATGSNMLPFKLPPPPTMNSGQRTYNSMHGSQPTPSLNLHSGNSSMTRHFPTARYAPATNWDGSPFEPPQANTFVAKKAPPPRPPPPRVSPNITGNTVLKKPGPPQSVNVLSNLFGRKKGHVKNNKQSPPQQQPNNINSLKLNSLPNVSQMNSQNSRIISSQSSSPMSPTSSSSEAATDVELIKFDSPPSSPTFTQKSNSDCVSVDSFSSDSNFSSPQNGSVSQPESGFEDDFFGPNDPWDAFSNANNTTTNVGTTSLNYGFLNDVRITQPVRNLNMISRNQNDTNPLCNGKSLLPPQQTLTMPTIIKPKSSLFPSSNSSSPLHLGNNNMSSKSQIFSVSTKNMNEASYASFENDKSSPPMPSCPPPPLPASAMLDVISGRMDAKDLCNDADGEDYMSYGIALYDFEGVEDGDLSFKENEKIYVLQQLNDEWYFGRNKRGCEGMFPSNFIEIKVPLKDGSSGNKLKPINNISPTPALHNQPKVRVLYNFNAEVAEDLTLKENDLVSVLHRINDDWLFGELNGRHGQFPANFLEYIPQNLPNKLP